ncbi:MAG TPA: Gfo/Idh/MocA family oxidoreductase [Verrucomicrobiae bacterium]|nr:Gfo/Idh/MocA family oxidoreductase [Verrucomicrobiae bacterium]
MKKESRLLRVGVLGCGPISQMAHFDACRKARNAELYAFCDIAEDLVTRMAAVHEPRKTFTSLDQMLDDSQVEAVIVGTADQFHVPLCRKIIATGRPVLVEKPLGVTVEECEQLRAELLRRQVVFQIANNRRFDPGIAFARDFVQSELGQVIAFRSWYCDSSFRYTMTDNLQPIIRTSTAAKRPEGNPKSDKRRYFMLTHGSHLVDTARYLAGEVTAVRARCTERGGSFCWFIEAELQSGALGHLELMIPMCGDFEEGFRIYGEHGSAQGKVFLPWYHKTSEVECFSARDKQYRRPLGEDAYTYKLQIEDFADTVLHGKTQRGAGIEDGLAAIKVMVAIARSAESGEKVKVSEARGGV